MARMTGSWLSGPPAAGSDPAGYPGERLGLPERGVGSLASTGRRVVAMLVDWLIAQGIASLVTGFGVAGSRATWALLLWFVMGVVSVTLVGFTSGQYFLGLKVTRVDAPATVGFIRAVARQVALVFVIPALFTDSDARGMHDQATGTAVVRTR